MDQVGETLVGVEHGGAAGRVAHGPRRRGSVSSGTTVARSQSAVRSASSTSRPPPAATTGSALSRCSPLPIGSGTYTAGRPTVVTSQTVLAPARHSTRSAAA